MNRRSGIALTIASLAGSTILLGCSLLTSFDGLVTLDDDAGTPSSVDAASDANPLDSSVIDASTSDATEVDASTSDGSIVTGGGSDSSAPKSPVVTIVQILGSTGKSTVSFTNPTTAGNLLVAMEPIATAPSGGGWQSSADSDATDVIYFWPDNPGALQSFSVADPGDIILVELSGAGTKATIDFERDTGAKSTSLTTLTVNAPVPAGPGELALLYIDSDSATSSSTPLGWTSLGTDNNNNFGWFRIAGAVGYMAQTTFAPSTRASLMTTALIVK